MKKRVILLAVVMVLVGWAVYDFTFSEKETATGRPLQADVFSTVDSNEIGIQRGQLAPDFELKTLEGKTVQLSDYRGQRVLLNFWATWCPPCRAEMPDMQKLYTQSNLDVEILAVNLTSTENNEEVVAPFVDEYGLTFPVLMDRSSDVSNLYSVYAYPTTYMIESDGRIQFVALGAINYDLIVQEVEKMK
ncbi:MULTISPECIES: redoxin domain-containing protein [unclassified Sporosarcina]|uniref:redoxin domain-containing protein n=1 Tax=unclassified Sporosarcina TaxID=2647733 RepID=UPI00203BAB4F|nr:MULTISPECIES: redoxin domain-containing protein [unclassified Sporosarcina]GKV64458.1 thiol:disulfide interchange protein tlpA [Sporosarcina sp. NCCP-2331]GLB55203.1 thiol:disulfide interchange protein tlpA [Sporosarcina sp. NCCP-2378]